MRSTKSDVYMFNGKFIFDLINSDLAASLLPCSHVQTNNLIQRFRKLNNLLFVIFCDTTEISWQEKVLYNIMSIFTFMGLSVLRQDDAYSFQVIKRTVEAVIPALIQV